MKLDSFITRPVLSTVISIVVVILGVIGLVTLPIEQYPDIAPPTIVVRAYYPGADAQTVQNSVLAPLEEQINGVEGMTYMTSSATNDGSASITVLFEQGSNPDMAQVNVQNRVSQASALLPAEVTKGGVTVEKRQTSTVLIMGLVSPDDRYDEKFNEELKAMGYEISLQQPLYTGGAQGIMFHWDAKGTDKFLNGGADSRRLGFVVGF